MFNRSAGILRFALKRHLRRNQVIYPERPAGSVTTGTGSKTVIETVYRRQDVKTVRSPMQWYRLGRGIKTGEQPLKHATARKRKWRGEIEDDEEDEEENREMGLYAIFQTEEYTPPLLLTEWYQRTPSEISIFTSHQWYLKAGFMCLVWSPPIPCVSVLCILTSLN